MLCTVEYSGSGESRGGGAGAGPQNCTHTHDNDCLMASINPRIISSSSKKGIHLYLVSSIILNT